VRGGCFEDLRTGPTLRDHATQTRLRKQLKRIFYHISRRARTQIVDTLDSSFLDCSALQFFTCEIIIMAPSSVGGNSSSLHDSQGVDELATLDRCHHLHGHSGL